MIPFENTWTYEEVKGDYYFSNCPFCSAENILLPLKKSDFKKIRSGTKKQLVMPCCYGTIKIVDVDADYVLADRKIRSY